MTHLRFDDIFYAWFFEIDDYDENGYTLVSDRHEKYYANERLDPIEDDNNYGDPDLVRSITFEYIDRGVGNFKEFADALCKRYPNLIRLEWTQNYSWSNDGVNLKDIIYFIEKLNLQSLKIKDFQTKMFDEMTDNDWRKLLHVMPEGAKYSIEHNLCDDIHFINGERIEHDINETLKVYVEGDKQLMVNIGDCELSL